MSRRGRSGPTISLFSFQDIITSVTAIVTVITLLLALDLVQRKQSQASDSAFALAADFLKRLERSEAELARLTSAAASTDDLIQEVASTSPAELRNEIAERESTLVELERERQRLEQKAATWRTREKEAQSEQFELQPLKVEQSKSQKTVQELEQQLNEEKEENRTIFTLPRGFQKEGWLVEIDVGTISIAPLGRRAVPRTFQTTGFSLFGQTAANRLEKWIDEQKLTSVYFLLLIRPEAASDFDEVESLFRGKALSYGFDLIDADQKVLHPERGAAP